MIDEILVISEKEWFLQLPATWSLIDDVKLKQLIEG